ncbi:divergent PAP2 family protein [Brevibacillus ruminantium]|uniref:Divergent PAP2 family protein n=1 Tax=Brevibacillus ruminantium TaxID=2950604 RepID=A0ABY4WFK1_9BACL|nr:divergent PAP2 family protein [Brevibacillus ruminantium]USG65611.1 divergent PAP2 family protein [Brevibacillus ruminantium]
MFYAVVPFIGWLVSGSIKFLINYLRFGKEARAKIGNGGFPSTHTTVMVTSIVFIGLREGFDHPVFGLGVAVTFIIIIDAMGLRRAVGKHAAVLNRMTVEHHPVSVELTPSATSDVPALPATKPLRESMGHTKGEIVGGVVLGILLAKLLHLLSQVSTSLLS